MLYRCLRVHSESWVSWTIYIYIYLNLDHCYKLLQCINYVSTVINVQQIGARKIKCYNNNNNNNNNNNTVVQLL